MPTPHVRLSGRSPRACLVAASILAFIGAWRFGSDVLTDMNPGWTRRVERTWLRYTVRMDSDGTTAGDVNAQWFKLLAVPGGISCLYMLRRFVSADLRETQSDWESLMIRRLYVGSLLVIVTLCEVEKATHLMGLKMAGLLRGEEMWLNHVAHAVSGVAGWHYMTWLRFKKRSEAT